MVSFPRRGEIYWVDLNPTLGSEQRGVRPALVVQNDVGNEHSATTIVVPISSRAAKAPRRVNVPLPEGVLPKLSVARCGQVLTVDKTRLQPGAAARIDAETMAKIDEALRVSLGVG